MIAGDLSKIRIEDASGGTGNEVDTLTLAAGSSIDFFAVGYDTFDNFKEDVAVNWSVTGNIGTVGSGKTTSTTFTATTAGTGIIVADDDAGHNDGTGTLTITLGNLNYIKIVEGVTGDGVELDQPESAPRAAGVDGFVAALACPHPGVAGVVVRGDMPPRHRLAFLLSNSSGSLRISPIAAR